MVFALVSLGAHAQDVAELTEAERSELGRLFNEAREAYDSQNYEASIQKLMAAYEIFPEPNILYRIGEMHETLENRAMAAEYYERYLVANPDDSERALIESRMARLRAPRVTEKAIPSRLTIVTKPGQAEVYLVSPRGEDELLGQAPIEFEVEPGAHSIRVEKDGFEALTRRFDIGVGELRTAELTLEEKSLATPVGPPQEASAAPIYFAVGSFAFAGAAVAMFVLSGIEQGRIDDWDSSREVG